MRTRDAVAEELAGAHFAAEPDIERIFRLVGPNEDDPQEPVKLLEVNPNTIPEGIVPVQFGPDFAGGTGCSTGIIEITPEEFEQVRTGALPLPNEWRMDREFPRPVEEETRAE